MKVPPKRKGNRGGANTNSSAIFPSMKVPPKRKGNHHVNLESVDGGTLNESPSEKEGKFAHPWPGGNLRQNPSMKVPPKRKGNSWRTHRRADSVPLLNESPSEKEGKSCISNCIFGYIDRFLNESPSEKEGKWCDRLLSERRTLFLNESPSEKEGKFFSDSGAIPQIYPPQ